jgi:hypothetical protein
MASDFMSSADAGLAVSAAVVAKMNNIFFMDFFSCIELLYVNGVPVTRACGNPPLTRLVTIA